MTTRGSDDSTTTGGDALRTLEDFAPEERGSAAEPLPPAPESSSSLIDIVPAARRAQTGAFLSRVDSLKARRARRRRATLRQFVDRTTVFREWLARMSAGIIDGASRSRAAVSDAGHRLLGRTSSSMRGGTRMVGHAWRRLALRRRDATKAIASMTRARATAGSRALALPGPASAFRQLEANGFVVAVVLAVSAIGYGSLLTLSWQQPAVEHAPAPAVSAAAPDEPQSRTASAPAVPPPVEGPAPRDAAPIAAAPVAAAPAVLTKAPAAVVHRAVFSPSPRTITAMWQDRDTRSLDQAFDTLRRRTLAFHRCGMRMTDANQAVARCEGIATASADDGTQSVRPATWTIAFTRAAGRWRIADVTMR